MTAFFILAEEYVLLGKAAGFDVIGAVSTMVGGGLLAGYCDQSYDSQGYVLILLNCFATATFLVLMKKTGAKLDTWSQMYYNTVFALPVVAMLCWWTGELYEAIETDDLYNPLFQVCGVVGRSV